MRALGRHPKHLNGDHDWFPTKIECSTGEKEKMNFDTSKYNCLGENVALIPNDYWENLKIQIMLNSTFPQKRMTVLWLAKI